MTNWREHQLYGRYDIPVGGSTRVLLNPGLFLHEGRAPNGTIPGRFLGFVQGVGLQLEGEDVSWTPAVAVIAGRAQLNSGGARPPNGSLQLTGAGVSFNASARGGGWSRRYTDLP